MNAPGAGRTWFEDDRFWLAFSPHVFSAERAAEAAGIVATSPLFALPEGARVLDLCCGPGLFAVPLARRGHVVTGVDLSPRLLERAEAACRAAGVEVSLVEKDMRDYVEPGAFDAVVNTFTSFGYFEDPEDDLRVLRNAHASLAPGGTLLVDVVGKEVLARLDQEVALSEQDGRVLVQRDTVFADWSRLRSDWFSVDGDRVDRASLVLRLYSAVELRSLFHEAGFAEVRCYGGYRGTPYDRTADRLVVVGTKGGAGGGA